MPYTFTYTMPTSCDNVACNANCARHSEVVDLFCIGDVSQHGFGNVIRLLEHRARWKT